MSFTVEPGTGSQWAMGSMGSMGSMSGSNSSMDG